ncbi:MAG: hypothetical protein RIG63_11190 [Coleofasciculus chthonoplastes F3-SA18-01]|uniref:hypothetical protein n=1 Tax=Coleofasciculus chthonoplastes TaxID=64178 RepID=UPI0032F1B2C8
MSIGDKLRLCANSQGGAIALLRPNSEAARVVSMLEGKPSQGHQSVSASLCEMIRIADEEELETAMLLSCPSYGEGVKQRLNGLNRLFDSRTAGYI